MREKLPDEELVEQKNDDDVHQKNSKQTDREIKDELAKVDETALASLEPSKRRLRLPASKKKRWLIFASAILVVLIILGAIPYTRYKILGLFVKEQYTIVVLDSVTKTPVTGATVRIGDASTMTNANGQATMTVSVGDKTVLIHKQYYRDLQIATQVGLIPSQNNLHTSMVATGRQVPVVVVNKISGKPVANAKIKSLDTTAETDVNGKATIVLPASTTTQQATVSATGYNSLTTPVMVKSSVVPENTFSIVPSGHIYFLSNLSGKIDVVSTNLDGSNRTTVLAGTGNETANTTALLASRDWKYLALQSTRDAGTTTKIYVINTATNSVSVMDEGQGISFQFVGWSGDNFVYTVNRPNALINGTYPQQVLKSFDAQSGHITTIDQTDAQSGGNNVTFSSNIQAVLLNDGIFYTKFWDRSGYYASSSLLAGKTQVIVKTKPDGTGARTLKTFDAAAYQSMQLRSGEPNEVYYRLGGFDQSGVQKPWEYFKYDNGTIQSTTEMNDANFYNPYSTYLLSPASDATFWSVPTDGKYNLFVGNQLGDDKKSVGTLGDYNTYGWYTDNYLLVSKSSSELYIMPKNGGAALKISDYFKPSQYFSGYGGGYGGI